MKKNILSVILLLFGLNGFTQPLSTANTMTPTQLVQNVLLGAGVSATNITFNGIAANSITVQAGTFNGATSNMGIANGVILATGNINVAQGPNNLGSAGTNVGTTTNDPDLCRITGPSNNCTNIRDKAILEFDFVPMGDSVKFRYVFGSEEYPEFVNSSFNDAFGFFLSGPGITGIYSNNAKNIALIPNTTTAVTINNVNNGNFSGCPTNQTGGACTNCQYYVNNCSGTTVQYDGFTTVLEAKSAVQCGQTYHIKIAISDLGDGSYDSGVFLEGGSFSSENIQIATTTVSGDSSVIEGCDTAMFAFIRPPGLINTSQTIYFTISGTAANGTDYVQIADSIVFTSGQAVNYLSIIPNTDGIFEGAESLIITVVQANSGCGNDTITALLYIVDEPDPVLALIPDSIVPCNATSIAIGPDISGGATPYTYNWSFGSTAPNPNIPFTGVAETYFLIVTDRCANKDTVNFLLEPAEFEFTATTLPDNCGDTTGVIETNVIVGQAPYTYSINNGSTFLPGPNLTDLLYGSYQVIGMDNFGCRDTVDVIIDEINVPRLDSIYLIGNDPTVEGCDTVTIVFSRSNYMGDTLVVHLNLDGTAISVVDYTVVPDSVLILPGNNTTSFTFIALADGLAEGNETFIIHVYQNTMGCGEDTITFLLNIADEPDPIVTVIPDSIVPCNTTSISVSANIVGGAEPYNYNWSYGEIVSNPNMPFTGIAETYYLVVSDRCGNKDSTTFNIAPTEFQFISTYSPATCGNDNGIIIPDPLNGESPYVYSIDNGIQFVPASDLVDLASGTYTIIGMDDFGCRDTISIEVLAIAPPTIDSVSISNNLCYGDSLGFAVVFPGEGQAGSTFTYLWDYLSQTNDTAFTLPVGSYLVTITETGPNGVVCIKDTTINVVSPTELILQSTVNLQPTCANNDGEIELTVIGGTPAYLYIHPITGEPNSGNIFNSLGQQAYEFVVTDTNGCSITVQETLIAGPNPQIDNIVTDSTSCGDFASGALYNDGSITINGSGVNTPFSYLINGTQQSSSNVFNNLPPGTYVVTFIDNVGCSVNETVTISSPTLINETVSYTGTTCVDKNDGTASIVSLNGGTPTYTISWSNAQSGTMANNLSQGSYTYSILDLAGCTKTGTVNIPAATGIQTTLTGNIATCGHLDGQIKVNANGGTPSYQYSIDGTDYQSQDLLTGFGSGYYNVYIKDQNNCIVSKSIIINQELGIEANFDYTIVVPTIDNESPMSVNFNNLSTGASSYSWTFGDGTENSILENPQHIYKQNGVYQISLLACYTNACCDTILSSIEVLDTLFIPNIFTPNGDGKNEVFTVKNANLKTIHATIYNRWGLKIYEWDDPKGYWNGKNNSGSDCSDGTYFYIISNLERSDGKKYPITSGTVTLFR
ncbi:MAG: choice-of-anchor L domain-containing protein [Bacteroidetes bacterium]|nr:choice-of-anchor L domain-containing protein [Bacteroidota bacterium]HET6244646.1 choice-of-anchor L domain-containing protein [Bacteroidia bacterium]